MLWRLSTRSTRKPLSTTALTPALASGHNHLIMCALMTLRRRPPEPGYREILSSEGKTLRRWERDDGALPAAIPDDRAPGQLKTLRA